MSKNKFYSWSYGFKRTKSDSSNVQPTEQSNIVTNKHQSEHANETEDNPLLEEPTTIVKYYDALYLTDMKHMQNTQKHTQHSRMMDHHWGELLEHLTTIISETISTPSKETKNTFETEALIK